ncbi:MULTISPECIES: NAD-dependent epimerase/dehydratase family protein [Burkholderia]|uniref:NAD-dependent epimerase/dehydratase n=3 Tax=Burkholderia orbicola TaxID=2978683 RepID=A0A0H2XRY3_BURO1|nr:MULTISPECIES: NAD-dependent epimerase/dehydratase family protein [Burkholderia]EKS9844267.1 SDR family NAD(P)-dependent oxidoreductase [Burkholderia cepacia]ABK09239.1 NAD-dependent epimerase/dehydratase [Burkholderia cenocepacia HI2424]AQQ28706.1 NAD(P)-dependent oxidoreductase [Burkholderia cenocepacia]AQT50887.1 NAD(P)-dependent oxidoreductase [Burkholderia cenocepacia]MBR8088479.1 SDR family NAD(P)-dependent oxidoreductase [Burkholderia cenocepacia]
MIATRILRRPRVLIVGCGDVGMRCVAQWRNARPDLRILALTSHPARRDELRAAGATPIVGDLDRRAALGRLAGLARTILHLAPPPSDGRDDRRTRALIAATSMPARRPAAPPAPAVGRLRTLRTAARQAGAPVRAARIVPEGLRAPTLVYASTTGVYGDCGGARIDETHPLRPANPRAFRRVSAERQLRAATVRGVLSARIVRIPGIYAANRLPVARLERGTPALEPADDVYTNHIHADDLAAILRRAAEQGKPARVVHASDDTEWRMGEYFDRVAQVLGLPKPPRVSRADAERLLEPTLLSFMRESRRLSNTRLKAELCVTLRYPTVDDFLQTLAPASASGERR